MGSQKFLQILNKIVAEVNKSRAQRRASKGPQLVSIDPVTVQDEALSIPYHAMSHNPLSDVLIIEINPLLYRFKPTFINGQMVSDGESWYDLIERLLERVINYFQQRGTNPETKDTGSVYLVSDFSTVPCPLKKECREQRSASSQIQPYADEVDITEHGLMINNKLVQRFDPKRVMSASHLKRKFYFYLHNKLIRRAYTMGLGLMQRKLHFDLSLAVYDGGPFTHQERPTYTRIFTDPSIGSTVVSSNPTDMTRVSPWLVQQEPMNIAEGDYWLTRIVNRALANGHKDILAVTGDTDILTNALCNVTEMKENQNVRLAIIKKQSELFEVRQLLSVLHRYFQLQTTVVGRVDPKLVPSLVAMFNTLVGNDYLKPSTFLFNFPVPKVFLASIYATNIAAKTRQEHLGVDHPMAFEEDPEPPEWTRCFMRGVYEYFMNAPLPRDMRMVIANIHEQFGKLKSAKCAHLVSFGGNFNLYQSAENQLTEACRYIIRGGTHIGHFPTPRLLHLDQNNRPVKLVHPKDALPSREDQLVEEEKKRDVPITIDITGEAPKPAQDIDWGIVENILSRSDQGEEKSRRKKSRSREEDDEDWNVIDDVLGPGAYKLLDELDNASPQKKSTHKPKQRQYTEKKPTHTSLMQQMMRT